MTTTRTLLASLALAALAACGGEAPTEDMAPPTVAQQAHAASARYPTYRGPLELKLDDMITAAELDRTPGGYSLEVPGVGKVILDNEDPRVTSGCYMHRPSLIQEIAANPPSAAGPTWVNLTIWGCSWGICCLPPSNGACYKMVRFAAP
ncbi:MAG: hypothetical protein KC933_01975 [Myxococcales bacterium]|nr:hypothetical protein [Myxococcales bacterium]MCB9647294.1 hypothetical protein [Deltaproteobacteria bacterium]